MSSVSCDNDKSKQRFLTQLFNMERARGDCCFSILTKEKYTKLLREIQNAKNATSKTTLQYRRVKRFDVVVENGGVEKIVAKSKNGNILHYLRADEIYDAIETVHVATGHTGRDRLRKETGSKYANITVSMINLFLSTCEVCVAKKTKKTGRPGPDVNRILDRTPEMLNRRCRVDLIDMQCRADGENKFIMVHEDHRTRFVQLRPLCTDRADGVARSLLDIFLIFGAPCILHCGNRSRDFADAVIKCLEDRWSELRLVNGKSICNGENPAGPVEQRNSNLQDVGNMVDSWLKNNNTSKWSNGLPFIQFMKNRTRHFGIELSPYKAMFGVEPRVGLLSTLLPVMANATVND